MNKNKMFRKYGATVSFDIHLLVDLVNSTGWGKYFLLNCQVFTVRILFMVFNFLQKMAAKKMLIDTSPILPT